MYKRKYQMNFIQLLLPQLVNIQCEIVKDTSKQRPLLKVCWSQEHQVQRQ